MKDPRAARMTERELQDVTAALAQYAGWKVAHFRNSRTPSGGHATAVQYDGAGFPDLVLARQGRIIFAELKSEKGRHTDRQLAWLAELAGEQDPLLAGQPEVYTWRPTDWLDGTIRSILLGR